MGADLCIYSVQWRKGKTEKQTEKNRDKVLAEAKKRLADLFKGQDEVVKRLQGEEMVESVSGSKFTKTELEACLQTVSDACHGNLRDATYFDVGEGKHWFRVMVTGGMSWGDSPTDTYDACCKLSQCEVI